jgi:cytoskeletal protein CcmA (bactofilin family)
MFRRNVPQGASPTVPLERVTSVLGNGINWRGSLRGTGGIRIEGAFEGDIAIRGLVVIGETGRVTCENIRANTVIIAGAVRGNILAEKLEIRSSGRVWGDVTAVSFLTEEGAFLRGQVRIEDRVDLQFEKSDESSIPEGGFSEDSVQLFGGDE